MDIKQASGLICICLLLFCLTDCGFGTTTTEPGVVYEKSFTPSYYTYDSNGKSTHHSEEWNLYVLTDKGEHITVDNQKSYATIEKGNRVKLTTRRGLITHAGWMPSVVRDYSSSNF